jgi:predicted nucleic acid-binding protein
MALRARKKLPSDAGICRHRLLIALLSPRDELHRIATERTAAIAGHRLFTSEWVLAELLDSFAERGRYPRAVASALVAQIRRNPAISVVSPTTVSFDEAFQLYCDRADKRWSFTDCSSFLIMDRFGIAAALSHDRHFEQAGFRALLRE